MKILKIINGFFLKLSKSSKITTKCDISCQTLVHDIKNGLADCFDIPIVLQHFENSVHMKATCIFTAAFL